LARPCRFFKVRTEQAMISMVRVDDRLLHGQILCAWVPHVQADTMIVASDEAAADALAREIESEGYDAFRVATP